MHNRARAREEAHAEKGGNAKPGPHASRGRGSICAGHTIIRMDLGCMVFALRFLRAEGPVMFVMLCSEMDSSVPGDCGRGDCGVGYDMVAVDV